MSASAVSSAIRPLLTRRLLQHRLVQRLSRRPFHLTALREKKYTKFTEVLNKNHRGRTEPVGIKKMESSKPVVHIFDGISLSQLAIAAGKELDTMFDCTLEISSEKVAERCLEKPDEPLPRELVLDLLSYLHMRPQLGPQPKAKEVDHTEMDLFAQPPPPANERKKRAPVVTIMGHVDHGKTTLLDALRRSNIVAQEFGGITQHIGAFSVKLPDVGDEPVTFLDTPGHSAFKAMRERGARATDIVVLVVAADDGVMEQTVESIRYARESGVPMIVAINKCDKPGVDAEAVLQDLLRHEIVTEKFGGDTLAVQISALYGRGLDKLQEAILLQAELMQLESTSEGAVDATIIEASQMQGLGNVCTLIVNRGTLRKGTILVAGTSWGKVRAMSDEWNAQVPEAGPSTPVRIAGWRDELPAPGELALEAPNESKAQAVVQHRRRRKQEAMLDRDREVIDKMRAEARLRHQERRRQLFEKGVLASRNTQETPKTEEERAADLVPRLSIVLKCDVDGTLEAIQSVLSTYDAHDQVRLDVVSSAVGPVSETDLELAAETSAYIFTFNSPIHRRIQAMAEQRHVRLEEFHVIYKLVERLKEMLSDKMQPMVERRMLGGGTVIHVYRIPDGLKKKQPIAGIRVDWGTLERKATWRFLRPTKAGAGDSDKSKSAKAEKENRTAQKQADESIEASGLGTLAPIYEGPIESMQCEKQSINKATTDMEIGVAVEDKSVRYKEGDQVEVFEDFVPPQRIRWHPPGF